MLIILPYFCFLIIGQAAFAHYPFPISFHFSIYSSGTHLITTFHMHLHNQIPICLLLVLKRDIPQNPRVIEQDVNSPERLHRRRDDLLTILDRIVIGNSFPAGCLDLVDYQIRSLYRTVSTTILGFVYEVVVVTLVSFPSPLNDPPKSLTTTLAPRDAKNSAYALPRPPPAPVTTTTLPSKRSVFGELMVTMYVWCE